MKRFNIIFLYIECLFIMFFFSSCWSMHYFSFPPEDETVSVQTISKPGISLLNSADNDYFISINFNMDSKFKIENFEYYEGLVKIGEHEIPLNKNEISIHIYANDWLNHVYWIINGKWEYLNFDKQITTENEKENTINYMFSFSKDKITNKEIKKIINEYNKNNRNTSLYIKYGIVINNELTIIEINEKHNIEIITEKWNVFKAAIVWIFFWGRY